MSPIVRNAWILGVAITAVLTVISPRVFADEPTRVMEAQVSYVDPVQGLLRVEDSATGNLQSFSVADAGLRSDLNGLQPGDRLVLTTDMGAVTPVLRGLSVATRQVSWVARLAGMASAFGLLLFVAAIFSGWNPMSFLVGIDNRYSNSQCQLGIWFVTVLTVYLATLGIRLWIGGIDYLDGVAIPQNVLALTGLSALTFGGARLITTQKVGGVAPTDLTSPKRLASQPHFVTDLMQNDDGKPDIGDFQMIFISGLAVVIYLMTAFHFLGHIELRTAVTLPDVDSTLLSSFGIGQGAYLVKKLASDPGKG